MLSFRPKQNNDPSAAASYIGEYIGINRSKYDPISQAAKEYAVNSCMSNIASLKYALDNKLISGKPYTMSELYEQAIYAEKAFLAGVAWASQKFNQPKCTRILK